MTLLQSFEWAPCVALATGLAGGCASDPLPLALGEDTSGGATNSESSGDETGGEAPTLDCQGASPSAVGATWSFALAVSGLLEEVSYTYSASSLPAGLSIDASTGEITGVVAAEPGLWPFMVTITELGPNGLVNSEGQSATTVCDLEVRPHLAAPIDVGMACLRPGQDLRNLVVDGTGDSTPITCDLPDGNGNGRKPNGLELAPESCRLTGTVTEKRYGTWVFMMRGTQSGAEVFVPYCVTNDEEQGYEINGRHSGNTDVALLPIAREYDPTASFSVGSDMNPRYEITSPGICGASCFFRYSFLRTNAPIGAGGFSLDPDGLVQDDGGQNIGFFHELRVSGPPVPEAFLARPWVLSVAVNYCISGGDGGCEDVADGDAALEFGLIMVPEED